MLERRARHRRPGGWGRPRTLGGVETDTFVRDLLGELAGYLGPWLPASERFTMQHVLPALRLAEQTTGGEVGELWRWAAQLADTALWLASDSETARELWAEVRDICARGQAAN